ncbi:hypothetical protein HK101_003645, partial [Irineochytrium annulatum]
MRRGKAHPREPGHHATAMARAFNYLYRVLLDSLLSSTTAVTASRTASAVEICDILVGNDARHHDSLQLIRRVIESIPHDGHRSTPTRKQTVDRVHAVALCAGLAALTGSRNSDSILIFRDGFDPTVRSGLPRLPPEIMRMILLSLDADDLASVSLVGGEWTDAVDQMTGAAVGSCLKVVEGNELTCMSIVRRLGRAGLGADLTSLRFEGTPFQQGHLSAAMEVAPGLVDLAVNFSWSWGDIMGVLARCGSIKSFLVVPQKADAGYGNADLSVGGEGLGAIERLRELEVRGSPASWAVAVTALMARAPRWCIVRVHDCDLAPDAEALMPDGVTRVRDVQLRCSEVVVRDYRTTYAELGPMLARNETLVSLTVSSENPVPLCTSLQLEKPRFRLRELTLRTQFVTSDKSAMTLFVDLSTVAFKNVTKLTLHEWVGSLPGTKRYWRAAGGILAKLTAVVDLDIDTKNGDGTDSLIKGLIQLGPPKFMLRRLALSSLSNTTDRTLFDHKSCSEIKTIKLSNFG